MTNHVHWIETAAGRRYRIWSTVSDEWSGPEMTREECVEHGKMRWGEQSEAFVARADANDPGDCFGGRIEGDAWWLGAYEQDCLACGHDNPYGYERGSPYPPPIS
jgi:hypothetical protein